ncbi:MAG: anthranilate phosphoribosyltransferase [Phycisphaerales bacterium]|nr:anthranilate phosphoribosyltransferase [Phycisphaerales bacterium]
MNPQQLLQRLISRQDLSRDVARRLFEDIMAGGVDAAVMAAIVAALACKGESVDELVGAAEAMRARAETIHISPGVEAIDTCSAGGDGRPTFNISTAVAIVAAAAGATVAKHGNRSNARPSGSVEGLCALGVNVDARPEVVETCLREIRIGFLHAQRLHPAMKQAAPVRLALGVRTIFNLLGPLTNPASVKRQLLGVSRPELVEKMARSLAALGAKRVMVVHGLAGLCDLSLAGPSLIARLDGGEVAIEEVECGVAGVAPAPVEALYVDSPTASAATIERVLRGERGAPRDIVILNAAAALWVAGIASDWLDGARRAAEALDRGKALATLTRWREISSNP